MAKKELSDCAEFRRLREEEERAHNWKRWGTFLSERQWGTVREDYSENGDCWNHFTHDQARSRAYRWGEDGLFGFSDRQCRACFSIALWNGRDPFLKERLFGLTNPQGNHSEDVKECYYYLRATPTHSYQKALYKYPQLRFPYAELEEKNRTRSRLQPEFELLDSGVFQGGYYDVVVEYAKAGPDDILIQISVANRGKRNAVLHLLPQLWFRNVWSFGGKHLAGAAKPKMWQESERRIRFVRETLGEYVMDFDDDPRRRSILFTENSTNYAKLYNARNQEPCVKDAFHDYVVRGDTEAVSKEGQGTKAAGHYVLRLAPGEETKVRLRLRAYEWSESPAFADFDQLIEKRRNECDEYYDAVLPARLDADGREISLQAYAGLIWSKQFYYYAVDNWLRGDSKMPIAPHVIFSRRNGDWRHLFARDILSMPDKWEYPWFAAWDLAFHMVPFARIDSSFAKHQLELLLREWFMHPNGQIPAYEFSFSDVNPPVHAWAAWRVYQIDKEQRGGKGDRKFLAGVFHKLLMNFTWWVNQKDDKGRGIFSGGFLGLDNIGVFDRGAPLPTGGSLEQADATSWMAFYCLCMLRIALELAMKKNKLQQPYEDMASKFLEHFMQIADAINTHGGTGLWNDEDGFYYDQVRKEKETIVLKSRSLVGLLPLIAVENIKQEEIDRLPGFSKRFEWFKKQREDLSRHIIAGDRGGFLLAIASKSRLIRTLRHMLDEEEFLAPHGIRSLSRYHKANPFTLKVNGTEYKVSYTPGESETDMFGGNSNWRGPVWFPINHLLIEALERYHEFFGSNFRIDYPTRSGHTVSLRELANDLKHRHTLLFRRDENGRRLCHGDEDIYASDPYWRDLILFYEFFNGDNGKGLGASHQTGWTALVATHLDELARTP